MEDNTYEIVIRNKKIWNFYKETNLDIENTNLLLIDLIEKLNPSCNKQYVEELLKDMNRNIIENNSQQNQKIKQIQETVNETNKSVLKMENIKETIHLLNETILLQIQNISHSMNIVKENISEHFVNKLNEYKKIYMDEMKIIIQENNLNNHERIEKTNAQLQEKINSALYEIIPKNNDALVKELSHQFNEILKQEEKDGGKTNTDKWKTYCDSMEMRLNSFIQTNGSMIEQWIGKNNENLQDKMKLLLNEIIQKTNEHSHTDVLDKFQLLLKQENENLLQNTMNKDAITLCFQNMENKLMKFEEINAISKNIHVLTQKMVDFSSNSSQKGKISENMLYDVLLSLFPCDIVEYTGKTDNSGDFIIKRKNKCDLLIENKFYQHNVPYSEVEKFHSDIINQNMSGIFISQKYGISNKNNFEIDIMKDNFLVYIHSCDNNVDKIRTAVNIIDFLKESTKKIIRNENTNENVIDNDTLNEINQEFRDYILRQNQITEDMKTMYKNCEKIMKQMEDITFYNLKKYLNINFDNTEIIIEPIDMNAHKCNICNVFVGKNRQSLSAHLRGCKKQKNENKK